MKCGGAFTVLGAAFVAIKTARGVNVDWGTDEDSNKASRHGGNPATKYRPPHIVAVGIQNQRPVCLSGEDMGGEGEVGCSVGIAILAALEADELVSGEQTLPDLSRNTPESVMVLYQEIHDKQTPKRTTQVSPDAEDVTGA